MSRHILLQKHLLSHAHAEFLTFLLKAKIQTAETELSLTFADWHGEEEQGCQGDAGRVEGTHGAAAEAVQAAGGSALRRLVWALEDSRHLPLSLAFLRLFFPLVLLSLSD